MNRMFSKVCYNNASKNRDFEFNLCHKKYVFMLVCLLMYLVVCHVLYLTLLSPFIYVN